MSEPLLTKDAINIAGHKIPIALVGALAAVAGVIVILRARSTGSTVAAAGAPAPDTPSPGVLGQDQEAQLANLSQQLFDIQQSLATQQQPSSGGPPAQMATPSAPEFPAPRTLTLQRPRLFAVGNPIPITGGGGDPSSTGPINH